TGIGRKLSFNDTRLKCLGTGAQPNLPSFQISRASNGSKRVAPKRAASAGITEAVNRLAGTSGFFGQVNNLGGRWHRVELKDRQIPLLVPFHYSAAYRFAGPHLLLIIGLLANWLAVAVKCREKDEYFGGIPDNMIIGYNEAMSLVDERTGPRCQTFALRN